MKTVAIFILASALAGSSQPLEVRPSAGGRGSVTVAGQSAGPTPFISMLNLIVSPANGLKSIQFRVAPKPGSVTRAVSATYDSDYLQSRGYFNPANGLITLPVFGLYENFNNTVTLTSHFARGSSPQNIVTVPTAPFSDPCGYHNLTRIQARTNSTNLSYDFILVKSDCGNYSPTILDTDGEIRWVGTAGFGSFSSIFFQNGVYIASDSQLIRMELDGTPAVIGNYTSLGTTDIHHHNIDRGKHGLILDANTSTQMESFNIEVDASGNVLKTWDLAAIISAAMTAGGDDPTQFVYPTPTDWFHNNSVTYRSSDDSVIVSSRENFVICIDYESGAIKWILGDPTKKWHQFPSLRQYALALGPSTLPPIGQHAVSITQDDSLLLFDDGKSSVFQSPVGADRAYSAPRKYHIDTQAKVATETWNYQAGQTLYSAFCSSVYEDSPQNYLVDYALIGRIIGLDSASNKIFDYQYVTTNCNTAWNSIPVHLEGLVFAGPTPLTTPKVTISVAPATLTEGASATFTISASAINPSQATSVHYSMKGTAQLGSDYTLSGVSGEAEIPAGASSTSVTLQALMDATKEKAEKATMRLEAGANYKLSKMNKATVKIVNAP